ncbi:AAC(3) family N-acetyltransferase [Halomarina salina]|uniref:AAC(3) family N-acetyltransferase n=1 Tax=Halomarina salina TaxID=1872699 RepID=A0ABD5RLG0_9EURY|nr:AAC(3) family N-acetyltransferase [Halomarina salina]
MSPNLLTNVSRAGNLLKHQTLKQVNRRRGAGRVPESRFDDLLARYGADHSTVFVHAGLADVKAAFGGDPYRFLLERLDDHFESVIAPGFTDYFATSGVYHKEFSRPKHGSFVRQFLDDADYRTDDAIKSFLVRGDYRFEDCVHEESYHEDGCFAKLVEDDVLVLDVGTPWLVCSHLHFFESRYDVDYVAEYTFDGVRYSDRTTFERIEQTVDKQVSELYSWNKPKLMELLDDEGVLDRHDLNGLNVLAFTLGDVDEALSPKLRENPYWLVTL